MARKGRLLELVVERLEAFLAPEGVAVTSPELFYDDQGRLIGEVDVTLRGRFGSSEMLVGFECRDQPKRGRQGVGWIRELAQKRRDLGIDKMIAVSSSGFTGPAITLAERSRIDLLSIAPREDLHLPEWFRVVHFVFALDSNHLSGPIDIDTIPPISISGKGADLVLLQPDTREAVSLGEFIDLHVHSAFDELPSNPDTTCQTKTVLDIPGPVDALVHGQPIVITRMRVPLTVHREVVVSKALLSVCSNLADEEVVGLTGTATIRTQSGDLTVLLAAKRNPRDETLRDVTLSLLDEDLEPSEIPSGTNITLYGVE